MPVVIARNTVNTRVWWHIKCFASPVTKQCSWCNYTWTKLLEITER